MSEMPPPWFEAARTWLGAVDEVAPGLVEGLYLVGSVALQDWQHSSDIDIVAITSEPADDTVSATLRTAHGVFVDRQQGSRVDGPFLAWGDLTSPPVGVSRPWTLDGVFHHDAECFEINPVTWYTLATYGVVLRGPQPRELRIPLDTPERIRFVRDNAASYWTDLLGSLRGSLSELAPTGALPSTVPQWCLLGACRMLYTASTGDVASKTAAGLWTADEIGGKHGAVIEEVVRLRSEPEQPVGVATLTAAADAMADVLARINPTR